MTRWAMGCCLGLAMMGCATTGTPPPTSAITVHNRSGYALFHLHLSPVQRNEWSADHVGSHVLHDGTSLALRGVECGRYDLRVLDEDGDECVLRDQAICGDHGGITLNGAEIANCPGWTPASR